MWWSRITSDFADSNKTSHSSLPLLNSSLSGSRSTFIEWYQRSLAILNSISKKLASCSFFIHTPYLHLLLNYYTSSSLLLEYSICSISLAYKLDSFIINLGRQSLRFFNHKKKTLQFWVSTIRRGFYSIRFYFNTMATRLLLLSIFTLVSSQ